MRNRREQADLTQEQVGELAGVTSNYVSQVEREVVIPSWTVLVAYAKALHTSALALLRLGGFLEGIEESRAAEIAEFLDANPEALEIIEFLQDHPGQIASFIAFARTIDRILDQGEEKERKGADLVPAQPRRRTAQADST